MTRLDCTKIAANVATMSAWENISKELYRAKTHISKTETRAENLAKELHEKYEDDNAVLASEIAELNTYANACRDLEAACYARLSAIGHKELSDWESNYAIGRDCYFSQNYRDFIGKDKADFDETVKILRSVLTPVVQRLNEIDKTGASSRWSETSGDYLELLTKGEYKRIQNSLSHFANALYGADKLKFRGDSVAYFMFSAIRPNKKSGLALPKTDKTLRNSVIDTVNRLYIGNEHKANKKINEK